MLARGDPTTDDVHSGASADRPSIYDAVRSVLRSHCISMSRMNVVTLLSDCATNCTSAASDHRDEGGRPLPGSKSVRVTRL